MRPDTVGIAGSCCASSQLRQALSLPTFGARHELAERGQIPFGVVLAHEHLQVRDALGVVRVEGQWAGPERATDVRDDLLDHVGDGRPYGQGLLLSEPVIVGRIGVEGSGGLRELRPRRIQAGDGGAEMREPVGVEAAVAA